MGHEWSPEFFDMMYLAMARRKAVEEVTMKKNLSSSTMIAALYANTNLDSKENAETRKTMIEEVSRNAQENYESIIAQIYGADDPHAVDEVDLSDPWWAAMQEGIDKAMAERGYVAEKPTPEEQPQEEQID